jgi:hypothetical protein
VVARGFVVGSSPLVVRRPPGRRARSANMHDQGPSLDLYGRRAAQWGMASGCGSVRRGWLEPCLGHTLGCAGHSRASTHMASSCPLGAVVWYPEARLEAAWRRTGPLQTRHGVTAGSQKRFIARRQRAQGHGRSRSFTPSWGGRSAARRPAHRQVYMAVLLDAAGASQEETKVEGREGRLRSSDLGGGVVVADSGKTGGVVKWYTAEALHLLCFSFPRRHPVAASPKGSRCGSLEQLRCVGPWLHRSRRVDGDATLGASSFLSPIASTHPSPPPSCGGRNWKGENPRRVGERPAGGLGPGVLAPGQGGAGAKSPRRHGIGRLGGDGYVAGHQWSPLPLSRHRQGQKGKIPLRTLPLDG